MPSGTDTLPMRQGAWRESSASRRDAACNALLLRRAAPAGAGRHAATASAEHGSALPCLRHAVRRVGAHRGRTQFGGAHQYLRRCTFLGDAQQPMATQPVTHPPR